MWEIQLRPCGVALGGVELDDDVCGWVSGGGGRSLAGRSAVHLLLLGGRGVRHNETMKKSNGVVDE